MPAIRRVIIAVDSHLPYEWHQQVYIGAQRYAKEVGKWRCVIDESPSDLLGGGRGDQPQYDGVIARVDLRLADRAGRLKLPLVNTWANSPAVGRVPSVFVDTPGAMTSAAEHLLERGFRRFGVVGSLRDPRNATGYEAFIQRLHDAGIEECATLYYHDEEPTFSAWWTAKRQPIYRFIDGLTPPAAVLSVDPYVARQIVHRCHDKGWKVPQDVAVVCKTPSEPITQAPPPSLSAIDCNYAGCGYEAARLLDRLMNGEPPPASPIIIAPNGLVQRDSTDFFAVDDPLVAGALRYITSHISKPLDADAIADAVHTSASTLRRRFKQHLHRPLGTEIRRLRIELAKRLLSEPDRTIKEVANAAGFTDAKRMHEVFHRELAAAPSDFRRL